MKKHTVLARVALIIITLCCLIFMQACGDTTKEYTVTFVADGSTVATATYTIESKEIKEPAVPEKVGYTGVWGEYELTTGDITVTAKYTAIEYTVTFSSDGETLGAATYTVENKEIEEPAVPEKEGYTGAWETYELTTGDITVTAKYTAIEYTVTFSADGETVGTATYTVENKEIEEPTVPEKVGYTGAWEEYELTTGDKTVNAEYTATEYTATLKYLDGEEETVIYTIENREEVLAEIISKLTENTAEYKYSWEGLSSELPLENGKTYVETKTPAEYNITFIVEGETYSEITFNADNKGEISFPEVPDKENYEGAWDKAIEDITEWRDYEVTAIYTAIEYTITFSADGETVGTATYTVENKEIEEPEVPEKEGYTGAWEEYELTTGDITVNAEYTAIEYTVTFSADGETVGTATYTVENKEIEEPVIPEKEGYTGAWETYELTTGDKTVNAEYTAIEYTVTFSADGETVATATYTVENKEIEEPAVPEKEGYTGAWETYELTTGDITVNAEYTAIEYTVTFSADGETVGTATYTVENKEIEEPAVPEKDEYTGAWEDYELTTGDKTVNAVYTAIEYTVTFSADGETVATATYTVENKEIEEPTVPAKDGYIGAWEEYTLTTGNLTVNAEYIAVTYITKANIEEALLQPLSGYYVLAEDIDMSEFTSWGSGRPGGEYKDYYFTGTLDGNGHTISNFKVTQESFRGGLLWSMNGATVKNLIFKNAEITVGNAGLITGRMDVSKCVIENVFAEISVMQGAGNGLIAPMNVYQPVCEYKNVAVYVKEVNGTITNSAAIAGVYSYGLRVTGLYFITDTTLPLAPAHASVTTVIKNIDGTADAVSGTDYFVLSVAEAKEKVLAEYDWGTELLSSAASEFFSEGEVIHLTKNNIEKELLIPSSGYYVLDEDIDMSEFTAWGSGRIGEYKDYYFTGTLDGNGHTISNFKVTIGSFRGGLLWSMNGATVKNLIFKNAETTVGNAGLITGRMDVSKCVIENVFAEISVMQGAGNGLIAPMNVYQPVCEYKNVAVYVKEVNGTITNSAAIAGVYSYGLRVTGLYFITDTTLPLAPAHASVTTVIKNIDGTADAVSGTDYFVLSVAEAKALNTSVLKTKLLKNAFADTFVE